MAFTKERHLGKKKKTEWTCAATGEISLLSLGWLFICICISFLLPEDAEAVLIQIQDVLPRSPAEPGAGFLYTPRGRDTLAEQGDAAASYTMSESLGVCFGWPVFLESPRVSPVIKISSRWTRCLVNSVSGIRWFSFCFCIELFFMQIPVEARPSSFSPIFE